MSQLVARQKQSESVITTLCDIMADHPKLAKDARESILQELEVTGRAMDFITTTALSELRRRQKEAYPEFLQEEQEEGRNSH